MSLVSLVGLVGVVGLVGCSKSKSSAPPTTTIAPTTTTMPPSSDLTVDGVRPGVLQAPFYPQITVTQVTCGTSAKGGHFVQINLPAGGPGTTAGSVLTKPTEVIVVPGTAVLVDPRYPDRVLYLENMASVSISQGVLVLSLVNPASGAHDSGGDGLSVQEGAVQVNGSFTCPP